MTENELGVILREMHENAPSKEQTTFIHLFGIKFADTIKFEEYSVRHIVKISGIGLSYQTEVSKGIRLSKYVDIRNEEIKK